ncbi:MAG: hypothetical protein R8M46_07415 [Ghiorsea sp.]
MNTNDNVAMDELRQLLFEKESGRIAALEELLSNQELHAQEIAKVLAEAVQLRNNNDNKLGIALSPVVEEALKTSIARNPKPLSDALFPVMGPAIRKAINSSIASMLQSLNQTLEHSFSAQGLQWRIDAMRTGKSFAEIVILNTLLYRVEQVFLIHKETGLLLHHLSYDPSLNEDADVVSSMLTAVRDFIRDSFAGDSEHEIENLRLGDLEIIIDQGPDVVLAVVCRGNPPRSLHTSMSPIIEDIQHLTHDDLQSFDGDSSKFDTTDALIAPLMVADYDNQNKGGSPFKAIAAVSLIIIGIVGWFSWGQIQQQEIDQRWQTYIEQLNNEPGIIITHIQNNDGNYTISGLRDPLSVEPKQLLEPLNLATESLTLKLQSYHALQAPFILKRAHKLLNPPTTVEFALQDQTLQMSGTADQTWITHALQTALFIAGINQVEHDQLSNIEPLIDKIHKLLTPPNTANLTLDDSKLIISGTAMEGWAASAKEKIKQLKEVTAYQDKLLVLVDSPVFLLKKARVILQPPRSVQLFITANKTLVVKGYASEQWAQQTQNRVKKIKYLNGYNDRKLALSDNVILQRAIKHLNPPSSVTFGFENQVLSASGLASESWIAFALKEATSVKGVTRFDSQIKTIVDDDAILQNAIQLLQPPKSVTLTYSKGILHASGRATEFWIQKAEKSYSQIEEIHSFYTSELINTTASWLKLKEELNLVAIDFVPTKAQLTPEIQLKLVKIASLFSQAQSIEPSSQLQVVGTYTANESLITKLRLDNVKGELLKQGIAKKHIATEILKETPTHFTFILSHDGK